MSKNITAAEYAIEIESLATDIRDEAAEYSRDLHEALHETIDSHEWVIYTSYHKDVLYLSQNSDAAEEGFGAEGLIKDGEINYALMVFCAMERDVFEAIGKLPEK